MTDMIPMKHAEPVIFGVLKTVWADDFAGIVDLRPLLAKGEMFAFLRKTPDRFLAVTLEQYGHKVFWVDDDGDEIDFGTVSLREGHSGRQSC